MTETKKQMSPEVIAQLILALEQLIAGVYAIIQNAGLSADETNAYIARIVAAQAAVPDPKEG
jgi:hypothetical protein